MTRDSFRQLLRIRLVTPGNFGSAGGSSTVDFPLARDVWTQLPYLPASSLKGVIAGRFGNVESGGVLNTERTRLFGSPDGVEREQHRPGAPSRIHFTDGRLLAFAVRLASGRRARVVPLDTLTWLQKLGASRPFKTLPYADPRQWDALISALELPGSLRSLSRTKLGVRATVLAALLPDERGEPVLVAAREAAARMLERAVELRAETALDPRLKTARRASLRTAELLAPDSVFLSLVSFDELHELPFPQTLTLQVGAWEGTGSGWVDAKFLDPLAEEEEPIGSVPGGDAGLTVAENEIEIMTRTYLALRELSDDPRASSVRTVIRELGSRWCCVGLSRTLAFSLARARAGTTGNTREEESSATTVERQAHRFVLRHLLRSDDDKLFDVCHRWMVSGPSPADYHELELRWLWLRRYAETLLPEELFDDA